MTETTDRKKRLIRRVFYAAAIVVAAILCFRLSTRVNWNMGRSIGEPLDSLDGVAVYYNGGVNQTHGRNTAGDYNVGLKYQCVEFAKRYYLEHYGHRMPDAYGHGKDFYDPAIADGALNPKRGLRQFKNGGGSDPKKGDLLVWGPTQWNAYGHVAIVSAVQDGSIEIVQQNPGPFGSPRITMDRNGSRLADAHIQGWLRMPN